ncbi:MAG: hypothetical protein KDA53_09525 [Hyphomonas sp.]|nr:hypothetical protein [Hyphomonas sp.]
MTVLAVASLALAGVACSESKTKPAEPAETLAVEENVSGTLNLSLGTSEADSAGGSLNLNIGGSEEEARLIGSGQLSGGNFGDVPTTDFGIDLDEEDDTVPLDPDDDIIRLDPK